MVATIETVSALVGNPLLEGRDFESIIQEEGRNVDFPLPKGKCAVYTFICEGRFLKIGQAGPNSGPRYQYDHYLDLTEQRKDSSTLAKSVLHDPDFSASLSGTDVKDWLKTHTARIDILFVDPGDAHERKLLLNFVEGLLQFKFKPKYEG